MTRDSNTTFLYVEKIHHSIVASMLSCYRANIFFKINLWIIVLFYEPSFQTAHFRVQFTISGKNEFGEEAKLFYISGNHHYALPKDCTTRGG